jgi:hypothetical protein
MVLVKSIDFGFLNIIHLIIVMNELIAIFALAICIVVITIVIRIYKESPRIRKNIEKIDMGD